MMRQEPYTVYVEINSGRRRSGLADKLMSKQMGMVMAALAMTMLLAIALSGSDEGSGLAIKSAKIANAKATMLSVASMTKMYAKKEVMNQVINTGLAGLPQKDVVLAKHLIAKAKSGKMSLAAMKTTKLQDADCANKDVYEMILDKFTGLATNLTTEKDTRFSQNATTFSEKASAYTAWIDSESAYREALAKKDTALSAVTYAQGKFDEYSTAVTAGEASYAETIAPMAAEKEDLVKQQEMIAQIVELIQGMAQPSAAKSVKAANLAQIKAKVAELSTDKKMPASMKKQALKIKEMTSKLQSVSAETIADAMAILNDMSEEITTRVSAIDTATTAADQNLAADKAEKLKWQVDVVNLSNEADKETAAANAADLVREQLAGVNSVKEAAYNDQADNYEDDMAQYAEEIEGVNQIVDVIQQLVDSC